MGICLDAWVCVVVVEVVGLNGADDDLVWDELGRG